MIKPLSQMSPVPILPEVSKLEKVLAFLHKTVDEPACYGWYHWVCIATIISLCAACILLGKYCKRKHVNGVLFSTATLLIVLEVFKQLYVSYNVADDTWSYPWSDFPFQFCSTPMYIMLLASFCRKGKLYDACTAFLSTYGLFAGVLVVLYPETVFCTDLAINIHTMIYHGLMIVIGVFLYATGTVKTQFSILLKALPIFLVLLSLAIIMNSIYAKYGDLTQNFNMFYISTVADTPMEWIDNIIDKLPLIVIVLGYTAIFSCAALVMLLCAMLSKIIAGKPLCTQEDKPQDTIATEEALAEHLT